MKYYKIPVLIKWNDITTQTGWGGYKKETVAECETVGFLLKRSKLDKKKFQIRIVMTHGGRGKELQFNGCKTIPIGCITEIKELK